MNKRVIMGIVAAGIGTVCLAIGFWQFKQIPFTIPVTLNSGEKAVISGSVPSRAWVGESFNFDLSFKYSAPSEASISHLRASIDMANVDVKPQGDVTLTFDPSKAVNMIWKVTPLKSGRLSGTLWVYAGSDTVTQNALLARDFQLEAVTFLGVSARWYRWAGTGFLAVAAFLILAFSRFGFTRQANAKNSRKNLKKHK